MAENNLTTACAGASMIDNCSCHLFPGSLRRLSKFLCPLGHSGILSPCLTWTFSSHGARENSPLFFAFSPALAVMTPLLVARHRLPFPFSSRYTVTVVSHCFTCYCQAKGPVVASPEARPQRSVSQDPCNVRGGSSMSHMISGRAHRRRLAILAALTCTLGLTGVSQLPAHAAPATAGAASAPDTRPFEPGEDEVGADIPAPRSNAPSHVPAANVPRPATRAVAQNPAAKAAEGLSAKDQRDSNAGNAFSLEPPDQ